MTQPDLLTPLLGVLEAERARQFDGFAGSRVDVVLPLRQAAVDAALAAVPRWPAPLEGVSVTVAPDNLLHVGIALRVLGFTTRLRLRLRLHPTMEAGVVRLQIDDDSLVARGLTMLGPVLGQLPDGVTLEGRHLAVQVYRLATQQGAGDLVRLCTDASFTSDEGTLWVRATVRAPAEAAPRGEPRDASTTRPATPLPLQTLLDWLAGATADADIRVTDRLANDLLTAALASVAPGSDGGGTTPADVAVSALQAPVVHFEQGAVRFTTRAVLPPASRAPDA